MTVELRFPLEEAQLPVARTPAADPRTRLRVLRQSRLQVISELSHGLDGRRLIAFVFGMMRITGNDIDDAVASADVEKIIDARLAETRVARACELLLVNAGLGSGVEPDAEVLRRLSKVAEAPACRRQHDDPRGAGSDS